ncbi:MAG: Ig-like domain-containing protein, partial [Candidatus Acidiferrales bacterium]
MTPADPSIFTGGTQQFTATGTYADNSTQNLTSTATWSSTNTAAATINITGLATSTGAGVTTIKAVSGSITGSTSLTVSTPTLVSVSVTPANQSISVGTMQQFTATANYNDSSTQDVTSSATWSSTNTAAATITSAGLADGVAGGTTTIHAVFGGMTGSANLTVSGALSGALAHWTFDDGTGSTAVDATGNGYNATLFNGVTWISGKIGGAVSVNNVNQFISSPSINLTATHAMSISMWANRTYTNGGGSGDVLLEFSSNYNSNLGSFGIFPDESADCGGVQAMEIGTHSTAGYNVSCFTQPSSGVWHHLAVVLDDSQPAASQISLYIDGVLQTPLSHPNTSTDADAFGNYPLYMFARGGTSAYAGGQMDDLQVYSRALSGSEIQQIYNNAAINFSMTTLPSSQTVIQGSSNTYTNSVTALNGFSGTVTFTVSGLPTGATATFNPTSVTGSGSTTMTVSALSSTATGSYPLTITGTSGSLTHTTSTTLVIAAPPDFTFSATPSSQTIIQGASTTFTPSVSPVNAFNGVVTFSVTGLPTGATATFNP